MGWPPGLGSTETTLNCALSKEGKLIEVPPVLSHEPEKHNVVAWRFT